MSLFWYPSILVRSPQNKDELRENVMIGKEEMFGRAFRNNKDKDEIKKYINDEKADLQIS